MYTNNVSRCYKLYIYIYDIYIYNMIYRYNMIHKYMMYIIIIIIIIIYIEIDLDLDINTHYVYIYIYIDAIGKIAIHLERSLFLLSQDCSTD